MKKEHTDKYIFLVCLGISVALFIGGFFCPPKGVIDGSVLTAGGILLAFATLGVAEHIAKVNALEDLNRIYNYNYMKGYPQRLEFNL